MVKNTAKIARSVIFDKSISFTLRATLVAIHAHARPRDGFAPVTAATIADEMGTSHWAVRKHIRDLERSGHLRRGHQKEHPAVMSGACPLPDCYGIYVAVNSAGKRYDWAEC